MGAVIAPADTTPLNIWSRSEEEIGRLMSHFAHTPFELDGVAFGSVEAFYTWLIAGPARRPRVAPLWGPRAKHEAPRSLPTHFDYHGRTIAFESSELGRGSRSSRPRREPDGAGKPRQDGVAVVRAQP